MMKKLSKGQTVEYFTNGNYTKGNVIKLKPLSIETWMGVMRVANKSLLRACYILLLLPIWANAQVNGTIQKTVATGTVRGNFGSSGLDTLPRVTGILLNGKPLVYNSITNKYTTASLGVSGIDTTAIRTVANSVSLAGLQTRLNAYQTLANLSTDLTSSATKYPNVNAVNAGLSTKAGLSSPTFTGNISTDGIAVGTNGINLSGATASTDAVFDATKGIVSNAVTGTGNSVRSASPTFTGTPSAPTATAGTNTTQLATTAFVTNGIASKQDQLNGTGIVEMAGTTPLYASSTGVGNVVRATSPTITDPLIGTHNGSNGVLALEKFSSGYPYGIIKGGSSDQNTAVGVVIQGRDGSGTLFDFMTLTHTTANLPYLSGTGTRMVVANPSGDLSTQAIPSGGAGGVTGVAVATANGLGGTSDGAAVVPTLTLRTTVSSPVVAGDGTSLIAGTTTGSGSTVVLATSPTLVTPVLGTATGTTITLSNAFNVGNGTINNVISYDGSGGTVGTTSNHPVTFKTNNTDRYTIGAAGGHVFTGAGSFTGTLTAPNLSGTNTGDQTTITGNAGTATALQTARTISGTSFDGTANITLNNTGITNGAGYITSSALAPYAPINSPTFTGTPTAPTATAGTNTTQLATTAFVQSVLSSKIYTGVITLSGNGTQTDFNTGIQVVGNLVLTAKSADAAGNLYIESQVGCGGLCSEWHIRFITAPPSGTNNIQFSYIETL